MQNAKENMVDANLVAMVAEFRSNRTFELEVRCGTCTGTHPFCVGVTCETFNSLVAEMAACPELVADEGWSEVVDYHYTTHRKERTRTRVICDTQNMKVVTEHICKTPKRNLLYHRRDDDPSLAHEVVRVALSYETPVVELPEVCLPTHARIKQRRCFRDVREHNVVWSYELSRTWSASSRTGAEQQQQMSTPTYEVECELVDENSAYTATRTDAQVAESLLLKSRMLLGESHPLRASDEASEYSGPPRKKTTLS